ncbi:Zona pellucida sperm-binding protein 3 [Dissostichus eleginoides]|uniref:Zona pellucida sperm-binding protein 3 n=1 Tax=Dissostichus eleginoides TaxID=100907 RepID=A0AAD9BR24_DISEL|nr:Zona pellucida sperm-binding protein 3 [Dissostichus eleginoides]
MAHKFSKQQSVNGKIVGEYFVRSPVKKGLFFASDDWQSTRPSNQFLLGDMMKFEVSVKQFHHVPLRVMLDSCVATVIPNIDTVPRYAFLGNNGCLFDSQLTDSSSQFLPRSNEDRLQFQVEAFKFQQDERGVVRLKYRTLPVLYKTIAVF